MLRVFLTAAMLALSLNLVTWSEAAEEKVALKTELPEEILAGTPPDVLALLYPGLEKLPEGKRPVFLVPKGTVNLASKKKVTSSESDPFVGSFDFVTDGKKSGAEGGFVELSPGLQWIQIDLGKKCDLQAVYLWHFFSEARSYHDVIVQVADDKDFKKNCQTIYSNDQDNSARLGIGKSRPYIETFHGRLVDAKGAKGRYVRLYSNGNTANSFSHYIEVEVFGQEVSK